MTYKEFVLKRWVLILVYLLLSTFVAIQTRCLVLGIIIFGIYILTVNSDYFVSKIKEANIRAITSLEELTDMNLEIMANVRVLSELLDSENKNIYLLRQYLLSKGFDWKEFMKYSNDHQSDYKSIVPKLENNGLRENTEQTSS